MIDDLFEVAVLEEHMLPRFEFVAGFTELVGDTKYGSVVAAVLDASVAVWCHPNPQIERPGTAHGEAEVWRHHDVVLHGRHVYFDRSTIERKHQGLRAGC